MCFLGVKLFTTFQFGWDSPFSIPSDSNSSIETCSRSGH
jgi:hypothetical protein